MKTMTMLNSISEALPTIELRAWVKRFVMAQKIARERQDLLSADPHILEDMGLTEADVARESGRAFWDLPVRR